MAEENKEGLKLLIVERMYFGLYFAGKHTAKQTIMKHYKNSREAEKAYKELVKSGIIVEKPTGYSSHEIYLNKHKIAEIRGMIGLD